jgi:putative ABC transport system permease protein
MSLRTSIRTLLRERAFTAAVGLTLAIGLGGCLAMFTLVKGVLYAPLPYLQAERLALVWMTNPQQGFDRDIVSYPIFRDWRDQSLEVFESMAVYTTQSANILAGTSPEEVRMGIVSEEFFHTVGVANRLGRTFDPADYVEGRHRVTVLSHGLWRRAFGGRTDIIGHDAMVNGRPYSVVGVLAPGSEYPADAELWIPLATTADSRQQMEARGALWLPVIARLREGVPIETAHQRMVVVQNAQNAAYPDNVPGTSTLVTLLLDDMVASARRPLWLLQGAVLLVLLIACANVSNLFLARATARERESATRAALGASWWRLSREWVNETLVLTTGGALAGLALAVWSVRAVVAAAPPQIPRLGSVTLDWTIVSAGAALTLLASLAIGVAPLWRVARADISGTLKEGGRTVEEQGGRTRVRLGLVTAQLALALMLLVGAGLLLRSFAAVLDTPSGFQPDGVFTARISLPAAKYQQPAQRLQFWKRLRSYIAALPSVQRVAGVTTILLGRLPNSAPIIVEGRPDLREGLRSWPVAIDSATPGYFDTVGMRVVRGRDVADTDVATAQRVVVVNETLAMTYFETLDVVGRRISFGSPGPNAQWLTIVGVVSNARRSGPELDARAETYFPHPQRPSGSMTLVVKTAVEPASLTPAIRQVVQRLDPEQPIARVNSLDAMLGARLGERRFVLALLGGFAAIALLLSAIGIYGVMAYTVGRRRHEFGVRAALGASRVDLVRLVLRQGAVVIVIGVLLGVGGAIAITRLMERLLFGVSATDPFVFAAATLLLSATALVACWVPARRAANADPMGVLRQE